MIPLENLLCRCNKNIPLSVNNKEQENFDVNERKEEY